MHWAVWGVGWGACGGWCRNGALGVGLAYRVETPPLLSGIARFSLSLIKKQIVFCVLGGALCHRGLWVNHQALGVYCQT